MAGFFHSAPATIESTAALPCGPRPILAAGTRRVSCSIPSGFPTKAGKRTRRRLLSSRPKSVPFTLTRD